MHRGRGRAGRGWAAPGSRWCWAPVEWPGRRTTPVSSLRWPRRRAGTPRRADLVVGTSRGVGHRRVAAGGDPASDLLSRSVGRAPSAEGRGPHRRAPTLGAVPSRPCPRRSAAPGGPVAAGSGAPPARSAPSRGGPRGRPPRPPTHRSAGRSPACRAPGTVADRAHVDLRRPARDGARVVFGRDDVPLPHLAEAVEASSAVPGLLTPVTLGGIDYVERGAHSTTNADLVAGWGSTSSWWWPRSTAVLGAAPPPRLGQAAPQPGAGRRGGPSPGDPGARGPADRHRPRRPARRRAVVGSGRPGRRAARVGARAPAPTRRRPPRRRSSSRPARQADPGLRRCGSHSRGAACRSDPPTRPSSVRVPATGHHPAVRTHAGVGLTVRRRGRRRSRGGRSAAPPADGGRSPATGPRRDPHRRARPPRP